MSSDAHDEIQGSMYWLAVFDFLLAFMTKTKLTLLRIVFKL